jgi:transcriptional regulator with XRE-family HTH domain
MRWNQRQLGEVAGVSLRTVQRWETQRSRPVPAEIHRIVDAARPTLPALADELETWSPRPKPPPPPAPPPAKPAMASAVLLDSVVCAAAEAASLTPQAMRPAVLAAFARAREAGLTVDGVIEAMTAR